MNSDSKTELDSQTASALSYVLGPITGLVFLFLNKDPRVRFHALQSTLTFSTLLVIDVLLDVTVILDDLSSLLWLFIFGLWLFLIYKVWSGEDVVLPYFGRYAKRLMKRV